MPLLPVCITDELNDLLLHYQRFKGNCSQAHLLLLGRSQRRLLPYILNSHSGIQAGKGRGALQRCPPILPTESSAPWEARFLIVGNQRKFLKDVSTDLSLGPAFPFWVHICRK